MADADHTRPEHSLVTGDTHQPEKLVADAKCGSAASGELSERRDLPSRRAQSRMTATAVSPLSMENPRSELRGQTHPYRSKR